MEPIPETFRAPRGAKRLGRRPLTGIEQKRRKLIRQQVFARDGGCKLAGHGRCFGDLTPHHRRKASEGGGYTMLNLVSLCAHHNDQLEADAKLAKTARFYGLVLLHGDPGYDQLGGDAA